MMSPKAARITYGVDVKDIANALGIAESTYRMKENGLTEFYFSEAMKFLDYFGLSINDVDFLCHHRSKNSKT